jgi:hypothetical protein
MAPRPGWSQLVSEPVAARVNGVAAVPFAVSLVTCARLTAVIRSPWSGRQPQQSQPAAVHQSVHCTFPRRQRPAGAVPNVFGRPQPGAPRRSQQEAWTRPHRAAICPRARGPGVYGVLPTLVQERYRRMASCVRSRSVSDGGRQRRATDRGRDRPRATRRHTSPSTAVSDRDRRTSPSLLPSGAALVTRVFAARGRSPCALRSLPTTISTP